MLCRLGIHSYAPDADGRFWCRRCGQQGSDTYVDPEQTPPTQGF